MLSYPRRLQSGQIFPTNFATAVWAPFSRHFPLWWMLELWIGAILAVLVAGWFYGEAPGAYPGLPLGEKVIRVQRLSFPQGKVPFSGRFAYALPRFSRTAHTLPLLTRAAGADRNPAQRSGGGAHPASTSRNGALFHNALTQNRAVQVFRATGPRPEDYNKEDWS